MKTRTPHSTFWRCRAPSASKERDRALPHASAKFSWLRDAPLVIHWRDIDVDRLRILAQFRRAGIAARSMSMDVPAYERWEAYATNTNKRGNPISADSRPAPAVLENPERALYQLLNDSALPKYRRVEHERIPLTDAQPRSSSDAGDDSALMYAALSKVVGRCGDLGNGAAWEWRCPLRCAAVHRHVLFPIWTG
ncbi:Wadjet anti-phage system protein JetD domain-containing protein [Cryobacterium sp. LW097]|uniref:Wadjet anti-phage system protein JetD domain-containing protein n=1 Tax=Cryobacterium sp. LW097 TaxID=1978566 RepID=UPI000EF621A3